MRKHKAHVAGGGFHNNGGNGFALSAEYFFQCGFVVKRNGNGVGGNVFRYARAVGNTKRCGAAACLNEQAVVMAVVAANEFNNVVASGIGACQAQCAHGGFGAAVYHAYHVHGRHKAAYEFGKFCFGKCRCAVGRTFFGSFFNGFGNNRVRVAQQQRAVA